MFSQVCHFVHGGGGGLGYHWSQVPRVTMSFLGGRVSLVPCLSGGGVVLASRSIGYLGRSRVSRGLCNWGVGYPWGRVYPPDTLPPPPWNYKSGRYASYWNAFLCYSHLFQNHSQSPRHKLNFSFDGNSREYNQ